MHFWLFQTECGPSNWLDIFLPTDASYSDPLGPQLERPKTAARKKEVDDDFADEDLVDMLPM